MTGFRLPLALRLLEALLETLPEGRVFTAEEAAAAGERLGLTATHVQKLLSEMSRPGGPLERPRRGLYVMLPPFGGRDEVRPVAIAVRAVQPSAISGQSALAFWGLIDQAPLKFETLATPTRISWDGRVERRDDRAVWQWGGSSFEFRRIPDSQMFGIRDVRMDSETVVPMFDAERTVVDELAHSPAAGAEILASHRDELDLRRLYAYAARFGDGVKSKVDQVLARELVAA